VRCDGSSEVGSLLDLPDVAHGKNPYPDAAAGLAGISTIHLVMLWSFWAWWILEVATMLSNSKRRALHDFIAGTVVMRVTPPAVLNIPSTGAPPGGF
jgi:hypothetical protein